MSRGGKGPPPHLRVHQLLQWLTLFYPGLHGREIVDGIGAFAAGAMVHARHHEHPEKLLSRFATAHGLLSRFVIIDDVKRHHRLVGPAFESGRARCRRYGQRALRPAKSGLQRRNADDGLAATGDNDLTATFRLVKQSG